MIAVTFIIVP